ncbi:alpha-1-macroglobulin-like isoform X2 [Galleria mellonella]|uniref:Alpha-1-macroglobulin-like isoform X2 n=1 Tax=Galleria mellonella TaxID=7137 RepID=A0ABM3MX14_GALME|nr:alpha-1-macroglobulin-like isoform X2 [Galleria mellonella]
MCFVFLILVLCSQYVVATGVYENITSNPCTDRNHLFLAPGVLTAGGSNRACISRFYPQGPVHVLLTLRTDDNKSVTASRDLPPGDGGCLEISVPQKPNTKADMILNVRYPEAKCTWERQMTVRIAGGKIVLVHTDRARYRPGEILRIRVFALKANLAAAPGLIDEIWLEGPRGAWDGARAAQWSRVPSRMGIAQVQHNIDEQAPTGKWTVRVRLADGSQGSAVFLVGNYQLPPFQMSVRHASKVLRTSERLVWTVCVRYPWTEAVEGMLVIRIRGAGGTSGLGIRTAERLRAPRACHRHAAASKRIGLNDTNPPDVVVADFSFQESGTGIWQNTTVVSQVVDKAISLEFLTKHRAVISPGLPYKLKIKATRWDEKPGANERVRVCRSPINAVMLHQVGSSNTTETCSEAVTDEKGIARVMFTLDNGGSTLYQFRACLHNDSAVSAPPLEMPAHRAGTVHAALGPLRATLTQHTPSASPAADRMSVPLYITLRNTTRPVTVHFVLITRGGIIHRWGATTQCALPNSGDHFQITSRDSYCYTANVVQLTNASDSLLDRHLLRVMLPIKLTHQVCPDSHLIAYFYYNNELISASKQFEMEECFGNKVELTWLSRQTAPGGLARLLVHAEPRALCALSALDTAASGAGSGTGSGAGSGLPRGSSTNTPAPATALIAALRKLMHYRTNLTEYDASRQCFLSSDMPELPTNRLELTASWLAAAGVRLLGGDALPSSRCVPAPAPLVDEDATVPRSDFSESWLWRLVDVGMNGSIITNARAPDSISRFEATAICVTKTGVAVSSPATLQVFREFFIHADAPKRLRRGDEAVIRYRLFNYLYEPLSVQVQAVTDPHLEGPTRYVDTACVGARAAAARALRVRARLPAAPAARLALRARAQRGHNCTLTTPARDAISDEVIIQITVDPEGVPVQDHQSALLCTEGRLESGNSYVTWTWPAVDAVPGTEALTVWAVGDIAGPLFADADALVMLPRGCGEQNMARLATNLLALEQLDSTSPAAVAAREHVARGFTRQLQYVHPSGGFSAFGGSDTVPSTWLTAFAIRYLRRAHKILSPDLPAPPAIDRAEQWLLRQQMENGCFRNEGQVFHKELRGGLNEEGEVANVALTAYVITSLIESSTTLSYRVVQNTLSCLRALPPLKTKTPTRIYAQALLGYTFMRLRKYEDDLRKTNEAYLMWERKSEVGWLESDEEVRELLELLKIAKRSGDYVWWETSSLATSVEATAYALLALSRCAGGRPAGCAREARAAIRWLSAHRNAAGGFISTQDTLVAIEALTKWSSVRPLTPANMTVTVHTGSTTKTVHLRPNIKVPDLIKLEASDQLSIVVKGSGCALVQATRSYHTVTAAESDDKLLSVQVTVHTDGAFHCTTNTSCFCAAVIEACVMWSGLFPEMALLELTLPGGFGADAQLLYSQLRQTDSLLRRIELSPKTGRTTFYLATRDGSDTLGSGGHQCYKVHAVGPKTRTKPAHVRVMDYYKPSVNDTQMYTIPEDCPARVSFEANQYHASDNLYNEARSLSGDIAIMNEYSFEDIPEGIPLDDPLYDNLTQDNKENINQINETQVLKETDEFVANHHDDDNDDEIPKEADKSVTLNRKEDIDPVADTLGLEVIESTADDLKISVNENTNSSEVNVKDDLKNFDSNINDPNAIVTHESIHEINSSRVPTLKENKVTEINEKDHKIGQEQNIRDVSSNRTDFDNEITKNAEIKHKIEERDDTKENQNPIQNPTLSSFHVIDTEKDLEVPSGIEGPVPVIVLPPQNFMTVALPPPGVHLPPLPGNGLSKGFQMYPTPHTYPYYQRNPYYRKYRRYSAPNG